MKKTMLCFAPAFNTKGRKDATGAFIPEAKRFLKYHKQDESMLHLIVNTETKPQMRRQVLNVLKQFKGSGLEGVFFFCHGYRKGIQFGFDISHLKQLASAIDKACGAMPIVCFYSCDVARDADRQRTDDLATIGGDGGFADEMRDALCKAGQIFCTVLGHTTAGHTTKNPHVRVFEGMGSKNGGTGGYYLVPRTKPALFKKWRDLLRTDYRFEYPFECIADILKELQGK